jgi:Phosphotransferase enzyme family
VVTTIADTPEALTPEWLTGALADLLDGAAVADVSGTPVGTGQMCDSVRLHLTYDRAAPRAPESVIAKQPAADEQSRATGLSLRSYETEVRFYQQLAPQLGIRTPRAYHADIDVTTGSFVLLLEDLAPARQGDQLAGCTLPEATAALDQLVGLHAPRWGDPALIELDWLYRDPEASRTFMLGLLPTLWAGFTERYADRLGPEVHEVGGGVIGGLEHYLEDPSPRTVTHGDYRLDNLLFGGTPEAPTVAVVDWQTCGLGNALSDVAYFIGAGLLVDERRPHEEALVRRYHERLVAAGVDLSWEDCWRSYRRGTVAGVIMALAASMLVERTERGDDMFMVMAERHARHATDLDALGVLSP